MLFLLLAGEGALQLGISVPGGGEGFLFVADVVIVFLGVAALPFLYLLFLSILETPIVRPLRHPAVRTFLWAGLVGVLLFSAVVAFIFIGDTGLLRRFGVLAGLMFVAYAAVLVFGLVAALSAFRRTELGSMARARARSFLFAFGSRDLLALGFMLLAVAGSLGAYQWQNGTYPLIVIQFLIPLGTILLVLFLSYGILRTQLFDIDLKVKWTLKRSTLLAGLAAVFFVVQEGVEALLPLEGLVPGIAGAALVGLLALPAWRLSGRLVERVMPNVADTEEYRTVRKREIYRAAVESAFQEGEITARERRILAALQGQLGLAGEDVVVIERDAAPAAR